MKILPTPDDPEITPFVTLRVALGGRTYALTYEWNDRDRAWYFGLGTSSGEPIVASVRVVLGAVLNAGASMEQAPLMPIVVVDPTGAGIEPTLTSLGKNVKIVYMGDD